MKLPLVVTFILVIVTAGTITICLSGAVTPRNSEYGSVRAVFRHYLGGAAPVRLSMRPRAATAGLNR